MSCCGKRYHAETFAKQPPICAKLAQNSVQRLDGCCTDGYMLTGGDEGVVSTRKEGVMPARKRDLLKGEVEHYVLSALRKEGIRIGWDEMEILVGHINDNLPKEIRQSTNEEDMKKYRNEAVAKTIEEVRAKVKKKGKLTY